MSVAQALEAADVRVDVGEAVGELALTEAVVDPLDEVAAPVGVAVAGLDDVVEQRTHVDLGERIAELLEVPGLEPGGDRDEVHLEEAEGFPMGRRQWAGKVAEVILDGRHQLLAHALHRARGERVDRGQALGEASIPRGSIRPEREVVGIGFGEDGPMEQRGGSVAEDRFEWHALELGDKLPSVSRLMRGDLEKLEAAEEGEPLGGAHGRRPAPPAASLDRAGIVTTGAGRDRNVRTPVSSGAEV